ncbi:hypothetical protein LQ384_28910 [Rhodococcus rhodochrous]|uniref:Uncharacterized protein n=1 Tax=Rhodococcus rhodochrous TaxID=1829 RepID=A0AAW4XQD5_RHORH|nr:hypothetical protein [Rhodococcus rhodochrous]MCD2115094.1 hypothetical protein [Rhodococcus rhodochrous]
MRGDRRTVWASLLTAGLLSSGVAGVLGSIAAVAVVEVLKTRRVGCTLTRTDGQDSWICPGGIAHLVPALLTVSVIWVLAMIFFVYRNLREADRETRARAAAISGTAAAVPLILQVAATVPAGVVGGVDPGPVSVGIAMCMAGIAVLICRRRSRAGFGTSCAVAAALVLATAPTAFLLAPILVLLAGALVAAIVLTVTRPRPGRRLPH